MYINCTIFQTRLPRLVLTSLQPGNRHRVLLLCESLRRFWKDVSGDEGNDTCIRTPAGRALTGSQDQKEIVRFGANKEWSQTSNRNPSAQIRVLNPFRSGCLLLLAEQRLDWVQCEAFQCNIQSVTQRPVEENHPPFPMLISSSFQSH